MCPDSWKKKVKTYVQSTQNRLEVDVHHALGAGLVHVQPLDRTELYLDQSRVTFVE